jgi:hypothetical protein
MKDTESAVSGDERARLNSVLPSSSLEFTLTVPVFRSSLTIAVWFFCKAMVIGVAFQLFSADVKALAISSSSASPFVEY